MQSQKAQQAIALQYEGNASAPKITAKGEGITAQEIIDLAVASGVMTHEDPLLAQALSQFELGAEIPEQLYTLIAELIAFSYILQGKFPEHWEGHIPVSEQV